MTDTREKLLEAKYFLERMVENQDKRDVFKYNLSAFLSAARSVTWIMQREFGKVPGFIEWYRIQQDKMRSDEKMRILGDKRHATTHEEPVRPHAQVGVTVTERLIMTDSVSVVVTHADGTIERSDSTSPPPPPASATTQPNAEWRWSFDEIPDMDVITVCREHMSKLESIVADCERLFNRH